MKLNYFNIERVTHGIKTALACLIGFVITKSVHFNVDQWLIITIIVVMCAQISVGSVVQKSYMRFLGTLTGSIIAIGTLTYFGKNEIAFAIVISLSAMLFSYLATGPQGYNEVGTLGAATVVIILIGNNPTLFTAAERFIEISLGLLIAALVSQFVLPIHARRHLRETQAATIRQLREFYSTTLEEDVDHYQILDEGISQSLIKQRKLSVDAGREPLGKAFNLNYFQQMLRSEKEILRSIAAMHHAFIASAGIKKLYSEKSVQDFHDAVCTALENIAVCIENKKIAITLPDIQFLKDFIYSQEIPPEKMIVLSAYLFSAEMLVIQLDNLAALVSEVEIQS